MSTRHSWTAVEGPGTDFVPGGRPDGYTIVKRCDKCGTRADRFGIRRDSYWIYYRHGEEDVRYPGDGTPACEGEL
jgi:hypothetical protein